MNDLEVRTEIAPLTANEIQHQVNRIQEVMRQVMKNGVHYGTIPGCGDKPALLKPGAEKLMMTFRMAVDPIVQDLSTHEADNEVCRYRVLARLTSVTTGAFLGQGIGECSSAEEKYAWRKCVEQEFVEADPKIRRKKWMRGKQGTAYQVMQVATNPADVSNTVLKMAKKRALIDAVLTVTAASDIFNQDIEEVEAEEEAPPPSNKTLKEKLKEQVAPAVAPSSAEPEESGAVTDLAAPDSASSEQDHAMHEEMERRLEGWRHQLKEAARSGGTMDAVNAVYRNIPMELRQDIYNTYQECTGLLKEQSRKKK